jgi:hypothetical protein
MIVDHEYVCIYIYMYIDCGILILDKNGIFIYIYISEYYGYFSKQLMYSLVEVKNPSP